MLTTSETDDPEDIALSFFDNAYQLVDKNKALSEKKKKKTTLGAANEVDMWRLLVEGEKFPQES